MTDSLAPTLEATASTSNSGLLRDVTKCAIRAYGEQADALAPNIRSLSYHPERWINLRHGWDYTESGAFHAALRAVVHAAHELQLVPRAWVDTHYAGYAETAEAQPGWGLLNDEGMTLGRPDRFIGSRIRDVSDREEKIKLTVVRRSTSTEDLLDEKFISRDRRVAVFIPIDE